MFHTIEVKNATTIHLHDLHALQSFGEDYREAKRYLICRGKEKLLRNGINIEPADEFLLALGAEMTNRAD